MKKIILYIICNFIAIITLGQSPNWILAIQGAGTDDAYCLVTDPSENMYVVGKIGTGTAVNFNPLYGSTTMTAAGTTDAYVAKYNKFGNLIWNFKISSSTTESARQIIYSNGYIYVLGHFQNTANFAPLGGVATSLTSAGGDDIFFAKYDATNGACVWAKNIGGTFSTAGNDVGMSIAIDATNTNALYITGYFQNTADFDPGPSSYNLSATINGATPTWDFFLASYNIADGTMRWAKRIGSTGSDQANAINIDPNGDILVCGNFGATVDFDPDAGVTNISAITTSGTDAFFAKYRNDGTFLWAKRIGPSTAISANTVADHITNDNLGNVYLTGNFMGTVDFDPSASTTSILSNGAQDIYFGKYDPNGGLVWINRIGSATGDLSRKIALDNSGNIFLGADLGGTLDVDPGAGTVNLTSVGSRDGLLAKYDNAGSFIFAKQIGGSLVETIYSLNITSNGNVLIAGTFTSANTDFSYPAALITKASLGGNDGYFGVYSSWLNLTPLFWKSFTAHNSKNEITLHWSTLSETNVSHFIPYYSTDGRTWTALPKVKARGNTLLESNYTCQDLFPRYGTNYYMIEAVDLDGKTQRSTIAQIDLSMQQNLVVQCNPITDHVLRFQSPKAQYITLLDAQGNMILHRYVESGTHAFDIKQVSKGSYFLRHSSGTEKIILY